MWFGGRFLQISVASHGKGDIVGSAGHCHPSHMQPLSDAELCGVSMQHLIQSHIWPLPLFGTVPLSVLSVLLGPPHKPWLSSGGIGAKLRARGHFFPLSEFSAPWWHWHGEWLLILIRVCPWRCLLEGPFKSPHLFPRWNKGKNNLGSFKGWSGHFLNRLWLLRAWFSIKRYSRLPWLINNNNKQLECMEHLPLAKCFHVLPYSILNLIPIFTDEETD